MEQSDEFTVCWDGSRGRGGSLVYTEGSESVAFWWELVGASGSPRQISVRFPSTEDWERDTPWPVERRTLVATRIADFVVESSRCGPYWELIDSTLSFADANLDREFLDKLGPENPDRKCRREGCLRGSVRFSVLCAAHQFERVKGRVPPAWLLD